MGTEKGNIAFYKEINDFLSAIPSVYKTSNPDFFCLRIEPNANNINNYMPPFKKGFYFIGLVTDAGKSKITYDTTKVSQLNSFLVFQSPGHIYSFYRDESANGYLIYFKKECFHFFKSEIENEFPFFSLLQTNFYTISQNKFNEFKPMFEEVFKAYESNENNHYTIAALKLLAVLYTLKNYTSAVSQWEKGFTSPQQLTLQKFIQLINNYYLEKRTVEEYAQLMNISSHHLSQTIKQVSGKNALAYINDRILQEAKSLIKYTEFDMAQIAYQLDFSDPANFGKFFKKLTGITPLQYRNQ